MQRSGRRLKRSVSSVLASFQLSFPSVQIYIKDVKSSNGTFINSERLSAEGAESDPFELKTDDIVVRLSSPRFVFHPRPSASSQGIRH